MRISSLPMFNRVQFTLPPACLPGAAAYRIAPRHKPRWSEIPTRSTSVPDARLQLPSRIEELAELDNHFIVDVFPLIRERLRGG